MNYDIISFYYRGMPVMFVYTIHKNTIILRFLHEKNNPQRNRYIIYIIYVINLKLTSYLCGVMTNNECHFVFIIWFSRYQIPNF